MYKSITISRRSYGLRIALPADMMIYRPLGQSGITASVVAHGTWAIGGWMWGGTDVQKSVRSIHASLDRRVNFIDTAPAYGLGHSERIVGDAIRGAGTKVILATKCGLVWHTTKGHLLCRSGWLAHSSLPGRGIHTVRSRTELAAARDDYIDLYQTHWQDPTTADRRDDGHASRPEKQGKIRAIGVSNCTLDQLRRYRSCGRGRCAGTVQACSIADWEHEYLPYCAPKPHRGAGLLALANGLLTGKVDPDRVFRTTICAAITHCSAESRAFA